MRPATGPSHHHRNVSPDEGRTTHHLARETPPPPARRGHPIHVVGPIDATRSDLPAIENGTSARRGAASYRRFGTIAPVSQRRWNETHRFPRLWVEVLLRVRGWTRCREGLRRQGEADRPPTRPVSAPGRRCGPAHCAVGPTCSAGIGTQPTILYRRRSSRCTPLGQESLEAAASTATPAGYWCTSSSTTRAARGTDKSSPPTCQSAAIRPRRPHWILSNAETNPWPGPSPHSLHSRGL